MPDTLFHATVLNYHQPCGNLDWLLSQSEWEAKEILWAMDRAPRALWAYEDVARIHCVFSGALLEQLVNESFQSRVYGIVKLGDMLWSFQNEPLFKIIGTGYYHPTLPLIPRADWPAHLERWQGIAKRIFWRDRFSGYWPSEMAFTMEMIPLLRRFGYRYVFVDAELIVPISPMKWHDIRYRPHYAEYKGERIIVVPRDRDLSNAQESGMDFGWFQHEVCERTKYCDYPPLVTTCTDGDNGGWFRSSTGDNFWSIFYNRMCEEARARSTPIRPAAVDDYLDCVGADGKVMVKTGAWNTGEHSGVGFVQWTGSQAQRDALKRVEQVSERIHKLADKARAAKRHIPAIDEAYWRLLRSQTSCNFFWGEAWLCRCHADLDGAETFIQEASKQLGKASK